MSAGDPTTLIPPASCNVGIIDRPVVDNPSIDNHYLIYAFSLPPSAMFELLADPEVVTCVSAGIEPGTFLIPEVVLVMQVGRGWGRYGREHLMWRR